MSDEDATYTCSPTMRVMPVVLFNLLVYFVIGLPNAIIGAQFVHNTLGFSTAIAASTISAVHRYRHGACDRRSSH